LVIDKLLQLGRRLRRAVSRTRWTAKLLGRERSAPSDQRGLVLLQIDGLARRQFEKALNDGRLPFLKKMVAVGHYHAASFYSGCPSTTPAVQGEIMFGQRCAVPAFQFFDRRRGKVVLMFDSEPAHDVAERLAAQGEPLLAGGGSYSNIYRGGAAHARFCAETLETDKRRLRAQPLRYAAIALLYTPTVLRVAALSLLELAIAAGDAMRGVLQRQHAPTELKFIGSRVAVSIVLREYVRVMIKLAIEQGAPVVYANFLGYDEQAHRRGPGSWFAHWALKGIDGVVADASRTARRSPLRDYEVVVFSDHGQEATRFYDEVHGRSIDAAVDEALADGLPVRPHGGAHAALITGGQLLDQRARRLLGIRGGRGKIFPAQPNAAVGELVVTGLGPLGHIYAPASISDDDKARFAERLVAVGKAPLALYRDVAGDVHAHDRRGHWKLPDDAAHVLGADHPFLSEATADLIELCCHPNAGDLVISGWAPGQTPLTFVRESGSHGSVGHDEVRGFALLPEGLSVDLRRTAAGESFLRGEDLYWASRELLGAVCDRPAGGSEVASSIERPTAAEAPSTLRVMTYNIHSCIGLDGRVRPERIAQVIRTAGADVVALQEVDSNRARSRGDDQARLLAERLAMSHHYYAVFEAEQEQYGLAIISRWPLRHVQSSHLTSADARRRREARGALWVELQTPWGAVQVINTHFGLSRDERLRQARTLVGDQWLRRMAGDQRVILCGDLNSTPRSPAYRTIATRLDDVQGRVRRRSHATFPSIFALRRLDHIFVSPQLTVCQVSVPRTPTTRIASDHLPLCAELVVKPATVRGDESPEGTRRRRL